MVGCGISGFSEENPWRLDVDGGPDGEEAIRILKEAGVYVSVVRSSEKPSPWLLTPVRQVVGLDDIRAFAGLQNLKSVRSYLEGILNRR